MLKTSMLPLALKLLLNRKEILQIDAFGKPVVGTKTMADAIIGNL